MACRSRLLTNAPARAPPSPRTSTYPRLGCPGTHATGARPVHSSSEAGIVSDSVSNGVIILAVAMVIVLVVVGASRCIKTFLLLFVICGSYSHTFTAKVVLNRQSRSVQSAAHRGQHLH